MKDDFCTDMTTVGLPFNGRLYLRSLTIDVGNVPRSTTVLSYTWQQAVTGLGLTPSGFMSAPFYTPCQVEFRKMFNRAVNKARLGKVLEEVKLMLFLQKTLRKSCSACRYRLYSTIGACTYLKPKTR